MRRGSRPAHERTLPTLRSALIGFAMIAVVPVLVLSAILIGLLVQEERAAAKRSLLGLAGTLTAAIDAEVGRTLIALQVLSLDEAFDREDFESVRRIATAAQKQHGRLSNVLVLGMDGTRKLNLRVSAGQPIPLPQPLSDPELEAARDGRHYVSGVVVSPTSGKPLVYVSAPVMRDGVARYVVSATMEYDVWTEWLAAQLPAGMFAAIDDEQGMIFARSAAPERFAGRPAAEVLRERYRAGERSGIVRLKNRDGHALYAAFITSTLTGWHALVLSPVEAVESPGWVALGGLVAAMGIAALFALLLATLAGVPLRNDISALRDAVRALGRGEPLGTPRPRIRELRDTALAAADAARLLKDRQRALQSARDALVESERRFRVLADQSPVVIWVIDTNGNIEFVNRAFCLFFGVTEDRIKHEGWQALVHPDDEAYSTSFLAALQAQQPWAARGRVRAADGQWRWIASQSLPRYSESGVYLGQAGCSPDVTDQVVAEEAMRAADDRLQLAISAGNAGAWDWDLRANRNVWSESHFTLLGLEPTPDRVASDGAWEEALFEEDADRVRSLLASARRERSLYRAEHRVRRADGALLWVRTTGRFLYDEHGEAVRFTGVFFDITEEKQAELALSEAARRKDEFLATLAHELRNPLAPIRNAVEILKLHGGTQEEAVRNAYSIIDRQATQLSRLLDDLLEVSRVTLGRISLRKEPIQLADVVQHAIEGARPLIENSQQRLAVHLPAQPVEVEGDFTRLVQVVLNLLNNAAKYSRPGGEIGISLEATESTARLVIEDTGIGIPAEMLTRVFELFAQVHEGEHSTRGGLGIGLSLVKRLVELHGGTVVAESAGLNQGSRFTVRLQRLVCSPAKDKVKSQPTQRAEAARRVLIVDDNADAADSLVTMLLLRGHEARAAYDGTSALEVASRFEPDVALLDIGLPGMSGHQLARKLREQPWAAGLTLVAITGWGQQHDQERSKAAGFDHHLLKPASPDVVLDLVQAAPARRKR